MTPTLISAIAGMRSGTTIDCIRGIFTKIYLDSKRGDNANGPWSFQNATFKDSNGDTIKVKFKNQDDVPQSWAGKMLEIVTSGGKNAKGIEVSEYKDVKELILHPTVDYNWIKGGREEEPQQHEERLKNPPPRQGPPPEDRPQQQTRREPEPEPEQQQRRSEPPANPSKNVPIHGATVGMAINKAMEILREAKPAGERHAYFRSPEFSMDLWTLASDVVRVSQHMEAGNLAKPVSERSKPATTRQSADADKPYTYQNGPEDTYQGGPERSRSW